MKSWQKLKLGMYIENNLLTFCFESNTVGEKKDSTKRYLWSKTILTTGSVGGPGVDPPPRKINTFFS